MSARAYHDAQREAIHAAERTPTAEQQLALIRRRAAMAVYREADTRGRLRAAERDWVSAPRDLRTAEPEPAGETLAQYWAGEWRDLVDEFKSFGWREWAQFAGFVAICAAGVLAAGWQS